MSEQLPRFWAVVPAAGVGARMQADRPKQYLPLQGKTVLEHTLNRLVAHPAIAGLALAVAGDDAYWPEISRNLRLAKPLYTTAGGAERCYSVLNALGALSEAADDDWVLVHDAARPCLRGGDIDRLIESLKSDAVGGLLGLPMADTVKRTDADGRVEATVPRERLWRALTPQMFRLGPLRVALEQALADGFLVTDEASAMEHAGFRPRMVEGHGDNIKITRPQDLSLAALYLAEQESAA